MTVGTFRLIGRSRMPASDDGSFAAGECVTGDRAMPYGLVIARADYFENPARHPEPDFLPVAAGSSWPALRDWQSVRSAMVCGQPVILGYARAVDLEAGIALLAGSIRLSPRAWSRWATAAQQLELFPQQHARAVQSDLIEWARMVRLPPMGATQDSMRRVIVALAAEADWRSEVTLPFFEIAVATSLSVDTVRSVVRCLEAARIIQRFDRPGFPSQWRLRPAVQP